MEKKTIKGKTINDLNQSSKHFFSKTLKQEVNRLRKIETGMNHYTKNKLEEA